MEKFFRSLAFLFILTLSSAVYSQEHEVTGTVTSHSEGYAMPGVQVVVEGTTRGTTTDVDGNYEIKVSEDDVLVFSFLGKASLEIPVDSREVIDVEMIQEMAELGEVVVTAFGIKREAKALGYSVTEVGSDQFAQTGEVNPISSLSGKVPGLEISQTTAGPSGSQRVTIRGVSEVLGNNQPLYVIDGVPVDNTTLGQAGRHGGYDLGDGTADLNPEDIESISVLKGASASALYGSRALNGVILITTKTGEHSPGLGVEFNSSTTLDVVSANLDEYQTTFGQGTAGLSPPSDQRARTITSAWGEFLNSDSTVLHVDGQERPYELVDNNIQGFFQVGRTYHNTLTLNQAFDKSSFRFSYGNTYNDDIIPGSGLTRNTFTLRGTTSDIGDIIDFDSRITYSLENVENRPALSDAENNIGNGLVGIAPSVDQAWLENYKTEEGNHIDWTGNEYRINPYWVLNENSNESRRNRLSGFASASINLHEKLDLRLRSGIDKYNFTIDYFYNRGTPQRIEGELEQNNFEVTEMSHEALLIFDSRFADVLDVTANIGGNLMSNTRENTEIRANNMTITGHDCFTNFSESVVYPGLQRKKINSLFGFVQFGYNDFLYLDVTGRNDWSSTLPVDNNSYFYPSVSGSFIPTELDGFEFPWLTFLKFRGSWAQVGGDTDPYKLDLTYTLMGTSHLGYPLGGIPGNLLPNPHLLPQTASSYEFGVDMRFLDNRFGLDVTYYNELTYDQIIEIPIPPAAGFNNAIINSGDVRNEGVEIFATGRLIDNDFKWDLSVNYSVVNNTVEALSDMVTNITIAEARWAGVNVVAREGSEFGLITGRGFLRDPDGNIVHDDEGLPLATENPIDLGGILPDWTGGVQNTFSYKGILVRTSLDIRMGGNIYSMTNRDMYNGGTHTGTLEGREEYVEWALMNDQNLQEWLDEDPGNNPSQWQNQPEYQPLDRGLIGEGVVIAGYDENDEPIYEENDIYVSPEQYWRSAVSSIGELNVYDASYVKLRDLSIGYTIPRRFLGNVPVESLTISAVGRNLFILYKEVPNIDPESSYNNSFGQGLEYGSLPSRRHFGFNLNARF